MCPCQAPGRDRASMTLSLGSGESSYDHVETGPKGLCHRTGPNDMEKVPTCYKQKGHEEL